MAEKFIKSIGHNDIYKEKKAIRIITLGSVEELWFDLTLFT